MLYTLPRLQIGPAQQREVGTPHRVVLRMCVGLQRYANNVSLLVAAEEWPVFLRGNEHASYHLERAHGVSSGSTLLSNLSFRYSWFGQLTSLFEDFVGPSGNI